MKKTFLRFLAILLIIGFFRAVKAEDIIIDASAPAKPIRLTSFYGGYHHNRFYFERSTAFKRAHDIIRETSHKRPSIKYWRCQNLLTYRNDPNNPDEVRKFTEDRSGHPYDTDRYAATGGYNWTKVNEVFDEIVVRSGLVPIVEFNYMPECMAEDPNKIGSYGLAVISPPKDHNEWKELIRNTVIHFQERYGINETQKWYFGVWNEPNYKEFWDYGTYGYDGFIKLYDYAAIPLKEVDSQLRIGGPDNTAVLQYSKQFVDHTYNGTNYCNGQVGSPADYFSVHAYSTAPRFVCSEAWKMARDIRDVYGPEYINKKILITECAPNFQMTKMPYLQNRYTACWLLALFDSFLEAADEHGSFYLPATIHYCGILRDFEKRSLLVSIGEDNDSDEVLKTAPFNAYEVMSMLSDERIPVQGCDLPSGYTDVTSFKSYSFDQIRCMATRTPGQSIEILLYHFDQDDRLVYNRKDDGDNPAEPYGTYYRDKPITYKVNLTVNNIPFSGAKYKKYVIDKYHSNSLAYRTMHWNTNDFNVLDEHDDLEMTESKSISISNGQYNETIEIQQNSVTLIVLENEYIEPGPHLGLSPTNLDYGSYVNTMSVVVSNYGDQPLNWSAYENPEKSWITSINPSSGTLAPNTSATVDISVDRSGLADGEYAGNVSFTSNGGDNDVKLTMHVGGPALPLFYRINAGGSYYTDTQGNSWSSDRGYTTGGFGYDGGQTSSTNDPIARTEEDRLYQTERYKLNAYRFDVPNGNYRVVLHFAEIYFEVPDERIMNVSIEGETKISNLDIYKEVGHDAALIYTFSNIPVNDGRLDITFSASSRVPKISAIEVINMDLIDPNSDTSPPTPPINVKVSSP